MALKFFGTEISDRSVKEALLHTAVEVITLVGWLKLAQNGETGLSAAVLFTGLYIEHVIALAAGKDA